MTNREKILYIGNRIGADEVLAQLAEEATELAQAALKCRRALTKKNPTPVSLQNAFAHIEEEYRDTYIAYVVLNLHSFIKQGQTLPENVFDLLKHDQAKLDRWVKRLEEAEAHGEDVH